MKKYKLVYYLIIIKVCKLEFCFGRQLHTPSQNSSKNSSKLSPFSGSKLASVYANLMESGRFISKSELFNDKQSGDAPSTKTDFPKSNLNVNDKKLEYSKNLSLDKKDDKTVESSNDSAVHTHSTDEDTRSSNCTKCNRNNEFDKTKEVYHSAYDTSALNTNDVKDLAKSSGRFEAGKAMSAKLNAKRNVLMSLSNFDVQNSAQNGVAVPSKTFDSQNKGPGYNSQFNKNQDYPYDPSGYNQGYGNQAGYGMDPSGMAPMGGSPAPMGSAPVPPAGGDPMAGGMGGNMAGAAPEGMDTGGMPPAAPAGQAGGYVPESYPPAGSVPGSVYPDSSNPYQDQSGYGTTNPYGYSDDWNNSSGYGNGSYPDYNNGASKYTDEDDIHESWKCRFLAIFFPECTDKKPKNRVPPPRAPMAPVSQQYCNIYGTTDLNLSDFFCNTNDWLLVNQNNSIRLTSNKPVSTMQNIELKGNYCNKESVSCTLQLGENSTAGLSVRGLNGERTLIELNSLTKTISLKQINNQTTQILLETPYSKMNSNFLHLIKVNDGGFQGTLSVFVDGEHVFSKRDMPTQTTGLIGMFISSGNATFGNLSVTPA